MKYEWPIPIHSGTENNKKSRAKKLVKSKNLFHEIFSFDQIPFFAISKMAKNQFFNWGKKLKPPEMQFHVKISNI